MFSVTMALWLPASADGSRIFPSAKTIATLIGASRNSVDKYRKALVELGMFELVSKGRGKGDSSVYRLCEPSQWRKLEAEFDAAMAAVPETKPKTPAVSPEPEGVRERVRAALQGATNGNALTLVRSEWAYVIEQDDVLNGLYCTRAGDLQRKGTW
jgi:Helix-turn-helix domain